MSVRLQRKVSVIQQRKVSVIAEHNVSLTRHRNFHPASFIVCKMKWNESGFRPPLCTYRLNWARRTSWGWWDDWDDTVLQTQDSKFEPWRSEAEHTTSRSRRLPTILTFTRGWGRNIICFFQTAETGNRTPNSGVKGSGANYYPRAPALIVCNIKLRKLGKTGQYLFLMTNDLQLIYIYVNCIQFSVQKSMTLF